MMAVPVSHGTDAVVTTKMVFAGSLRSVSGLGTSMTSARFDEGPPLGHQCATGAPQLAYRNLMPSSIFNRGWLVRNGAPVFVAMEPRRGSESFRRCGAALVVASSRTAAARRIAPGSRMAGTEAGRSKTVATLPFLAASSPSGLQRVNDDLFAGVLSILAAACSCTGAAPAKLKASGL